jgi:hypothetical protein
VIEAPVFLGHEDNVIDVLQVSATSH